MTRGTARLAAELAADAGHEEDVLRLWSPGFGKDGHIPRKYASGVKGDDMAPPLQWTGLPDGTEALALVMEDIDAPDPESPITPFTHWVVANIPATLHGLPEGFSTKDVEESSEYAGIHEGVNDFKVPHYKGPLPPTGTHRYLFTLYALDSRVNAGKKVTKERLEEAMEGHILAEATMEGWHGSEKLRDQKTAFRDPAQHEMTVGN